jgi:hypothetical protein
VTANSDEIARTELRTPTPGDLWREWLSVSPDPLLPVLDRAAREHGLWPVTGVWRRIYARLEPDPAAGGGLAGALVYQDGEGADSALLLVECRNGDAPEDGSRARVHLPWGSLRAVPFAQDPELPTLAGVLAANPTAHVLRYRPHHRATMRVDTGRVRFAKVFRDGGPGIRLYDEGVALWQAATAGRLTFAVPEPLGWDSDTSTLWMGLVPGEPVKARLGAPGGAALAERMGRACGELALSGPSPTQRFRGADQVARSGRYVTSLSKLVPHLADDARQLLDDLALVHVRFGGRTLRPIHGAPHMHQWLYDGDRLGLVDFDRHCLGDPELDAATFVAEVDCENPATMPRERLSAAFLDGYADMAGPLEPTLLAAYRAHKRLAKAEKTARKPLADAAERAARHLAAARRMLVMPLGRPSAGRAG